MKLSTTLAAVTFIIVLVSCKSKQIGSSVSYVSPVAIIYKTKADYSKNIPVTLSDDKSKIVSYPDPKDVYYQGKLAYPTKLDKNYLLDNRGVGPNSAFLRLTYEEYSKLAKAPDIAEMYKMIIDKDPMTSVYNLGTRSRFKNEVDEINDIIKHSLKQYKKLK